MNMIKRRPLDNGQYLTQKYDKKSIFLHHTVGLSADSAWRWWNHTPERVGTHYIIDRDGSITECIDPEMWAYHLGVKGDDNYHEKHSINIELVSAGPLRKVGNKYLFFPLWPNKSHAREIDSSEVIRFSNHWRGHEYFHKYTEAQIAALEPLLKILVKRFSIPKNDKPESFYEYNEEVLDKHLPGIWSHTTVRADKSDIYPDKRIISLVKNLCGKTTSRKRKKKS